MESACKDFSKEELILLLDKGNALGWWDKEVPAEAVVLKCSSKQIFLKVSQISLESTYFVVSLSKAADL